MKMMMKMSQKVIIFQLTVYIHFDDKLNDYNLLIQLVSQELSLEETFDYLQYETQNQNQNQNRLIFFCQFN